MGSVYCPEFILDLRGLFLRSYLIMQSLGHELDMMKFEELAIVFNGKLKDIIWMSLEV